MRCSKSFQFRTLVRVAALPVVLAALLTVSSCAPKVTTQVSNKAYPPIDYRQEVIVIGVQQPAPPGEVLGTVKVGDTGFTTNCGYEVMIELVKTEARKIGGNVVKITGNITPNLGSSCHRITATILRVDENDLPAAPADVKTLGEVDYALLHVYRFSGYGFAIGYDLYLGDSVICRVKNNSYQSIRITKDGRNMLWAKTEARTEVPINIEFGKEYYLRCSVGMGVMVGRPVLRLVDSATGKTEFESIQRKK